MFIDTRTIQTANIQSSSSSSSSNFNTGVSSSLNPTLPIASGPSSTQAAGVFDLDAAARSGGSTSTSDSTNFSSSVDNGFRRGLAPYKRFKSKLGRSELRKREEAESKGDKPNGDEGGSYAKMRGKKDDHEENDVRKIVDQTKTASSSFSIKTETNQVENSSSTNDGVSESTHQTTLTQQEALLQQVQRIQALLLSRLAFRSPASSSSDPDQTSSLSAPDAPCAKEGSVTETTFNSSSDSDSKEGRAASLTQARPQQDTPNQDSHLSPTPISNPNNSNTKSKLLPESLFNFQHQLADKKFMNFLTSVPLNSKVHVEEKGHEQGQEYQQREESTATNDSEDEKIERGESTESDNVRDVLDKWTRLVIPKHFRKFKAKPKDREKEGKGKEDSKPCQNDSGDDNDDDDVSLNSGSDDSSSIVISCPLEPLNEADIEIARSEVVSVDGRGLGPDAFGQDEKRQWATSFTDEGKEKERGKNECSSAFNWLFCKNHPYQGSESSSSQKEIRVWYPSRVKVSVEATWWGYRIYLPPPVMQILSDKSIEAAKRAALITAALSWLVSHIPIEMLPPQFKGLSLLLKEIVPLLGYIGGFIAWSWNSIRAFDKGDGVILSASWILPIALIPGTWTYTENPNCANENVESRHQQPSFPPPIPPSPPPPPPPLPPKDITSGVASGTAKAKVKEATGIFRRATTTGTGNNGTKRQK